MCCAVCCAGEAQLKTLKGQEEPRTVNKGAAGVRSRLLCALCVGVCAAQV